MTMEPDMEGDGDADMLYGRSEGAGVDVIPATPAYHNSPRSTLLPPAPLLKTENMPTSTHRAPLRVDVILLYSDCRYVSPCAFDCLLDYAKRVMREAPLHVVDTQTLRINDAPVRRISHHFTGRDSELETITRTIDSWKSDAPAIFVIYGSPGRGKSQLALRYADLSFSSRRYSHVFWASATNVEKASQGLANILDLVDHKDRLHPEQSARLTAARLWLENADRFGCPSWLLAMDNATWDTVEFLLKHLPLQNGQGTILVTTRTLDIAESITNAVKQNNSFLELLPLSVQQSVELLLGRAGLDEDSGVDRRDAETLVKRFGCLPLAVEQAGAYIKQKHVHVNEVHTLYAEDALGDIINWENTKQVAYEQNSVAAVFNIQLQNLNAISPDAIHLLKAIAFLDSETIPLDILTRGAERVMRNMKRKLASRTATDTADLDKGKKPSAVRRAIAHLPWKRSKSPMPASLHSPTDDGASNDAPSLGLKTHRLVELMCSRKWLLEAMGHFEDRSLAQFLFNDNPTLHIHDLNQVVLQGQAASPHEEQPYHALAVKILTAAFETVGDYWLPQSWAECERFVPHLISLEKHRPAKIPPSKEFMDMSQDIAEYFHERGRYNEAEALLIRVLAQREKAAGIGEEHLDTVGTVHALAEVYMALGKYDHADKCFGRALAGREKQIGPDHADTLATLYRLARLRYLQCRYDDAEELYVRLLEKRQFQLGAEHLDTLDALEGLAHVYTKQGKLDDAMPFYKRVLAGRENQLVPEHPDTLAVMANLGELYREQGKYDEAEPLLARVLRSRETQLGEEHPHTLLVVHNIASLYSAQGKYDEAETLYARVLAGNEKQLGAEHPRTLVAVHNFAVLRERQGRWEEAEVLYRRALAGSVKVHGDSHPDTRAMMWNLADLYDKQGRDEEAEALRARFEEVEQNV
ncbi:hypothetical protein HWV62_29350 [Athelia sp. TMB]|nr:hypothetical protein HWV62_29350 [Athelia sp. TMB]